jgi:hypothetical protein
MKSSFIKADSQFPCIKQISLVPDLDDFIVFIAGFNALFVEDAIRQLQSDKSLMQDK